MVNKEHQHTVKQRQQRNAWIVFGILAGGLGALGWGMDQRQTVKPVEKTETTQLASPLDHVNSESVWVERTQNQLTKAQQQQSALQQQLQQLQSNKAGQDKAALQQAQAIADLKTQVSLLQQQLTQQSIKAQNPEGAYGTAPDRQTQSAGFIRDTTLRLTPKPLSAAERMPLKNPDTFVPAGTYARAITLEGADASAGVTSQGDPTPMLFRILAQGTLPNHRKSHLKDCVATAAAIGDISSERGQIRLERLSCTREDGRIIELPVEATIAGPDGKNGVRGNALWREGALLQRAFAAGTLSGISNGIAQSYTTNSLTPYGQLQTVNNGKIAQYGLASGLGNAADKLADYNIKRAEQYHPVIQLSAGTVVDIVFLKGFYLDGQKHTDDESPYFTTTPQQDAKALFADANTSPEVSPQGAPAPLPISDAQIQALKAKNAQQGYQ